MREAGKRRLRWAALAAGAAVVLGAFAGFGPPQLMARTSTPEFCGTTCHVMESEYAAWQHSGPHARIVCIECHLPNDNVLAHYVWKGLDGTRDIVDFTADRIPDPIVLSGHGRAVVKANCVRCHAEMVTHIFMADRDCWECHRFFRHRETGVRAG